VNRKVVVSTFAVVTTMWPISYKFSIKTCMDVYIRVLYNIDACIIDYFYRIVMELLKNGAKVTLTDINGL